MEIKRAFKSSSENIRKENIIEIIRRFKYALKNEKAENKNSNK